MEEIVNRLFYETLKQMRDSPCQLVQDFFIKSVSLLACLASRLKLHRLAAGKGSQVLNIITASTIQRRYKSTSTRCSLPRRLGEHSVQVQGDLR